VSAQTYGVVGVGEIAQAIVTGLCDGVADPPSVLLSPRNAERSAALASRFDAVTVAGSNQEVLDRAQAILLCVRPQDAAAILEPLRFAAGVPVVSAMAGISLQALAQLVAPADELSRAIPMPPVSGRAAITPVYPAGAAVLGLFDRLGGSAPAASEQVFSALSVASGTIAAHLRYVATIADWLRGQGVDEQLASRYVASIFAGLGDSLQSDQSIDLGALASAHATPAGINERFAAAMRDGGAFELVTRSLDAIRDTL
jgi:pyrroline-5-carboxylate reductase